MKHYCSIIFMLISLHLFGQIDGNYNNVKLKQYEPTKLTDSTVIIGEVLHNINIGKGISMCLAVNGPNVKLGTRVFVVGYKYCDKNDPLMGFLYEIIYDTLPYYISSNELSLKGISIEQFQRISSNQFFNIREFAIVNTENGVLPIQYDQAGLVQYQREVDKANKAKEKQLSDLKEAEGFVKNCKNSGIVLYDYMHYNESDYTDGIGIRFKFFNPTNKVIKYVWTTFVGINAVGDKVLHELKGTYNQTVKSIGPIKSGEFGTYEYSYAWHNDIVDKVNIVSIEIQYMDGTKKKIINPKTVTLSKKHLALLGNSFDTFRILDRF